MKITFGYAPRKVVLETEGEHITLIAALHTFIQRPEPVQLSDGSLNRDAAREKAEYLLGVLQED